MITGESDPSSLFLPVGLDSNGLRSRLRVPNRAPPFCPATLLEEPRMKLRQSRRSRRALLCLTAFALAAAAAPGPLSPEQQYSLGMHQIMMRMDAAMRASPPATVDSEFVAMMVPHHQAAIDMAVLQLRYGHNPQLARIAQEIIVEQQQEITVMLGIAEGTP